MQSKIIEATDGVLWLKVMVAVFDETEWQRPVTLEGEERPCLLRNLGWTPSHFWLLDLATGNGAMLQMGDRHGGHTGGSGCSCHRVADLF